MQQTGWHVSVYLLCYQWVRGCCWDSHGVSEQLHGGGSIHLVCVVWVWLMVQQWTERCGSGVAADAVLLHGRAWYWLPESGQVSACRGEKKEQDEPPDRKKRCKRESMWPVRLTIMEKEGVWSRSNAVILRGQLWKREIPIYKKNRFYRCLWQKYHSFNFFITSVNIVIMFSIVSITSSSIRYDVHLVYCGKWTVLLFLLYSFNHWNLLTRDVTIHPFWRWRQELPDTVQCHLYTTFILFTHASHSYRRNLCVLYFVLHVPILWLKDDPNWATIIPFRLNNSGFCFGWAKFDWGVAAADTCSPVQRLIDILNIVTSGY